MSEKQGFESPPPAYNQEGYPPQGGYPPQQGGYQGQPGYQPQPGGFQTQPGYAPVNQGYPPPQQGYPPAQGQPQYAGQPATVVVTQQPYMTTTVGGGPLPPDYMVASILACLCCFWPTGLCAIYYACRRNTLMSEGNNYEANRMATNARNLIIASVVLGIIWIALVIILRVVLYTTTTNYYN